MPRRTRIRIPGLPLHITQRGNNKADCFWTDADRRVYLSLLRDMAPKFGCEVHAYVLMTNHVHLLITPDDADGASQVMKNLGQQYVQYVNRGRSRTGSLWDGRFKASIVDTDQYLLRCHRYVEMNPVRAGMVTRPGDYLWSSHRANAWGVPSDIVSPHPRLVSLGATENDRRREYCRLFETELNAEELEEIRAATEGGFALGSDDFLEWLDEKTGRRPSRTRARARSCGAPSSKADQVV